jgi:hypothetical protein
MGSNPKGIQTSIREIESKLYGSPSERSQARSAIPPHFLESAIEIDRDRIRFGIRRNDISICIQNLDSQAALGVVNVYEEPVSCEFEKTCGEVALCLTGVHRKESVATQDREACGEGVTGGTHGIRVWNIPAREVKPQLIADNQTNATC